MNQEIFKTKGKATSIKATAVGLIAIGIIFLILLAQLEINIFDDEMLNLMIPALFFLAFFGFGCHFGIAGINAGKTTVSIYDTYIEGIALVKQVGGIQQNSSFNLTYNNIDNVSINSCVIIINSASVIYQVFTSAEEAQKAYQIINQKIREKN